MDIPLTAQGFSHCKKRPAQTHQTGQFRFLATQPHLVFHVGALTRDCAILTDKPVFTGYSPDTRIAKISDQFLYRIRWNFRSYIAEYQNIAAGLFDRTLLRMLFT